MPQPVLDFLGRPIAVNDTVVYPVRKGSAMWLNRMVVSKVNDEGVKPILQGHTSKGLVTIKNLTNVVVVNPPAAA